MNETQVKEYLEGLLAKFNENPDHPELSSSEKVLLGRVRDVRKGVTDVEAQVKTLQEEVNERQQKIANLSQQLVYSQGAAQGLVEALVSLRAMV